MAHQYLDMTGLCRLGSTVTGTVIDAAEFKLADRVLDLEPRQRLTGEVRAVYPNAPEVVVVRTADRQHALIRLGVDR